MALGKCPVDGVGEGVFAEVAEKLLIDFEVGEVCCSSSVSGGAGGKRCIATHVTP